MCTRLVERCRSGLTGTPGKRVWGDPPQVRILSSPPESAGCGVSRRDASLAVVSGARKWRDARLGARRRRLHGGFVRVCARPLVLGRSLD